MEQELNEQNQVYMASHSQTAKCRLCGKAFIYHGKRPDLCPECRKNTGH